MRERERSPLQTAESQSDGPEVTDFFSADTPATPGFLPRFCDCSIIPGEAARGHRTWEKELVIDFSGSRYRVCVVVVVAQFVLFLCPPDLIPD